MPSKGTKKQRGYGYQHIKLRKQLEPRVAAGLVNCWRCGQRIQRGEPWDLGHAERAADDQPGVGPDRRATRGPEHRHCNRATSGRERKFGEQAPPVDTTRDW